MSITTTTLTRAAGLSAVAGGLLFIGVQINHPHLDAAFATTTEYTIRESLKVLMAVLSLIGITGIYLHQVKRIGVLGLIGYALFAFCYLIILSTQIIGVVVLPSLASGAPDYVNDVLAVAQGDHAIGDVGAFAILNAAGGITYLLGAFLFGIALFRARVLARWAAAVLAGGAVAAITLQVLPQINPRFFAIPTGVALIGLGLSLWREQRTSGAEAVPGPVSSQPGLHQ